MMGRIKAEDIISVCAIREHKCSGCIYEGEECDTAKPIVKEYYSRRNKTRMMFIKKRRERDAKDKTEL